MTVEKVVHLIVASSILCSDNLSITEDLWVVPSMSWGANCPECLEAFRLALENGDATELE